MSESDSRLELSTEQTENGKPEVGVIPIPKARAGS